MNVAQHILIFCVRLYRWTLSPAQTFLFGPLGGCRFEPTCSQYALQAVRSHGALAGSWLALKRLGRCHPWGGCGSDPVPENKAKTPAQPPPGKHPSNRFLPPEISPPLNWAQHSLLSFRGFHRPGKELPPGH